MRIIVMSDSHSSFALVHDIVKSHLDADLFVHLGDGEEEFDRVAALYPDKSFVGVKGNNDWRSTKPVTTFLDCEGVRIMLTHGDMFSVKWGLERLIKEGVRQDAKVVLYGHTHMARCDCLDGRYFINPGSVLDGRMTKQSYLMLDITPQGIVPNIRPVLRGPRAK